jgi:DNA-binding beta-propeller fold protein YncE
MVRCIICLLTFIGGPATSAHLNGPTAVKVDSVNNLMYIADYFSSSIRVVDLASKIITQFAGISGSSGFSGDGTQANSAYLSYPNDLAVDSAHDVVYIADSANDRVRVVDTDTGIITTFAGGGSTSGLCKF